MSKILITAALPYVNNVPHLGNIVGSVLSADVFARYKRLSNVQVMYICGTDEYGTATEIKAIEEKTTPQAICDKYHTIHNTVYDWFKISFDYFGRTSTPMQTQITQDIFNKCNANGYISEATTTQLYCTECKMFLADRYVHGTCPACNYVDARGDQCDQCGIPMNTAAELVDPKCKVCNMTPCLRDTTHLYLDLEQLQDKVAKWTATTSAAGAWTANTVAITNAWLRTGLRKRCITRDLTWGTPVPVPGYENKVFYVWFDAPIGYISITANALPDTWLDWWMPSAVDRTIHYEFMGSDNVPFHSVMFPATLIASGDEYTQVHHISTVEYLTYAGGKFSKSRGVGLFGDQAMELGLPPCVFRYYLLANRPETHTTSFTWATLQTTTNTELVANIGNCVNRICKYVETKLGGYVPCTTQHTTRAAIYDELNKLHVEYVNLLDAVKLRAGLATVLRMSTAINKYFQDSKPWVLAKSELTKNEHDTCISTAMLCVKYLITVLYPFIPDFTEAVCAQLNYDPSQLRTQYITEMSNMDAHRIGRVTALIPMITDAQVAEWTTTYS